MLREMLDRTGMLQAQTENWEAEDAIGAFCLEAADDDRIEIVSGDRDLIQLVRDPVVKLLFTLRGVSELGVYDEAGVLAKYGVPADRYGGVRDPARRPVRRAARRARASARRPRAPSSRSSRRSTRCSRPPRPGPS